MWQYLIKRGFTMVLTFIGITIVVFAILRLAPGDPTQQKVDFGKREQDSAGRTQQLIRFKQAHHLDKPLFVNLRPYRNYRPEMTFWLNFLTWHVPSRVRHLKNAEGKRRKTLLTYFEHINLPTPKTALDGEDFEVHQAARHAIYQTLSLNIADRSPWLIPLVYEDLKSTENAFRRTEKHVPSFRQQMNELQGDWKEEGQGSVREKLQDAISKLEERTGSISVSSRVTELDPDAPMKTNRLILRLWEGGPPIENVAPLSDEAKSDRQELSQLLDKTIQSLSADDLSAARETELKQKVGSQIEDFIEAHGPMHLPVDAVSLSSKRSPRFNATVAGLYRYRVRRRLDVDVRFLNLMNGDAFETSFQMPDKPLSDTGRQKLLQVADNVGFLWAEIWWPERRDAYEDLTPERRDELDGIMKDLVKADGFDRLDMIRYQLNDADIPYMIDVISNADKPLKQRAVASKVLIEKSDEAPEHYRMDTYSSAEHVQKCLTLWNRWWQENKSTFTYSTMDKLWWTVSRTQYSLYMADLAQLNFGETMSSPVEPVYNRLKRAIWRTAPLMLLATVFTYLMAIPLGIVCAVKQRQLTDRGISVSLLVLWAIPGYAAALILIYLFANPGDAGWIQLFPSRGLARYDQVLWHLVYAVSGGGGEELGFGGHLLAFWNGTVNYLYHAFLPMFSTSVFGMASLALYSRVSMLEVIRKDYIRTARAKGLSEFMVIGKHVVRNGLNPIITLFANLLPRIVGGSLIIEIIFDIQGVGKMFFDAALARDYNVMMCFLLITAILVMVGILISDLLYVVVNPRLDFEEVDV